MSLDRWLRDASLDRFPWRAFAMARDFIANSDIENAIEYLNGIVNVENLETRHHLQAWYFLRQLGQRPSQDLAMRVLGVVVEMGMNNGADLLAAYADHKARYINYSGKTIIWERPNGALDRNIDILLLVGTQIASQLGSPTNKIPPKIEAQCTRISFLTPGGFYFGQGPTNAFAKDPFSRSAINAATSLLQLLVDQSL
jgi:hypothetical protein